MRRIYLLLLLCLCMGTARAQMLAVKTNALMDVACAPNLTLEVATGSRSSLSLQVASMWDTWYKKWTTCKWTRMNSVAPEFRFWFGGRTFDRFFLGVGAHAVHYSFEWGSEKRRGNALGGGLTFGYDLYLTRHWVLDFHAGLGALHYWDNHGTAKTLISDGVIQDKKDADDNYVYQGDQKEMGWAVIPYQLGVSVVYIIK